ncbi:protein PAXX isoform X3 [Poecile atricapillus]|uniref:protein PAXX isoform X3 n=1 Tax=Poecile atricapillus TaxID=48891 RepID=UPI002738836F|nr:protein PAXX isoform X3 [Poecile atricapillus]
MAELPGPALGRIRRSRPPFVPAPSTPLSDAVMEEPVGPFHLLRAETGRFLCYCGPDGTVFVTDAMEVWAGELGGCPVRGCRCSPEERGAMLRAALGHGAAALSLGPDSAMLRLPEEPRCPALALAQLPAAEARSQLQALIFGMAGCIESLERRLEGPCPEKNTVRSQQLFLPDPSPRKSSASGSALPAKRKVHGESLINPGFKSKRAPSGVNFEDS